MNSHALLNGEKGFRLVTTKVQLSST